MTKKKNILLLISFGLGLGLLLLKIYILFFAVSVIVSTMTSTIWILARYILFFSFLGLFTLFVAIVLNFLAYFKNNLKCIKGALVFYSISLVFGITGFLILIPCIILTTVVLRKLNSKREIF